MAKTPQSVRWPGALAALDAIVGTLLVIAGLYFIDPSQLDIGFHVEAGRYALVGGFLIYAGLVLAYAGVFGRMAAREGLVRQFADAIFGTLARFCVGAILLLLSIRALLADPPLLGIATLAIPGVLALASLLFRVTKGGVENEGNVPAITAGSGKTQPFSLNRYMSSGIAAVVAIAASILIIGLALYAYVLLDALLIRGLQVELSRVVGVLMSSLIPLALTLAAFALAIIMVWGIASVGSGPREADLERDLSQDEISFASACVQQIRDLIAQDGLARLARWANNLFLLTLGAAGIACIVLLVEFDDILAAAYAPKGGAPLLYLSASPWSSLAALVLLLSWTFVPGCLAPLFFRRLSLANGAALLKAFDGAGDLQIEIVKRVRRRHLVPGEPFASDALRALGIVAPLLGLAWTALWTAGVVLWWPHDRALDTLYTEHGIETGEFWSMKRTVYPYADVQAVRIRCEISDAGSKQIGYEILLPSDTRRDLLNEPSLAARLDAVFIVDAKLRETNVEFLFDLPDQPPRENVHVVDRACVLALGDDMDTADRQKLERVFHLDEWFERRWRMRTGTLYVAGP